MFSQGSVILSTGGGGGGHAWQGGMHGRGVVRGGGHVWQGHAWQWGVHGGRDLCGRTDGHCSGRTHPTGMHSC